MTENAEHRLSPLQSRVAREIVALVRREGKKAGEHLAEHLLARRRDTHSVNIAFFKLNGTISTLFLGLVVVEVMFPWFRLQWADRLFR